MFETIKNIAVGMFVVGAFIAIIYGVKLQLKDIFKGDWSKWLTMK